MIDEYRSTTRKKTGLQKYELLNNIDEFVDATDVISTTRPVNDINFNPTERTETDFIYALQHGNVS